MSNFSALKTAIQNAIKQNGNEEITGNVLQQILLSIVGTMGDGAINTVEQNLSQETTARQEADTQLQDAVSSINTYLAKGYVFAGVATPTGTPVSGRVFYVATTAGKYTSFGNLQVQNGISILLVENGSWALHQLLVVDFSLVQNSNNPVRGGAVYQAIQHEETERQAADARLQNNINNENNRAVSAENGLHQDIVAETEKRRQEIQGMRDDVLDLIHEYRPIEIEGNVVNAPDEEDITQQPNNLLKFKDKDYNPTIFSGLGRKYLRKNIIINEDYTSFDGFEMNPEADAMLEGQPDSIFWDRLRERFIAEKDGVYYLDWQGSGDYIPVSADKIYVNENIPYFWNGEDLAVDDDVIARYGNILTQEMMSDANTIYVIQYDFTLAEDITVPANCVLEFDGGSISGNGTIDFNNCYLSNNPVIKCDFKGSISNTEVYVTWFGETNNECISKLNDICGLTNHIIVPKGEYEVNERIDISSLEYQTLDVYGNISSKVDNDYCITFDAIYYSNISFKGRIDGTGETRKGIKIGNAKNNIFAFSVISCFINCIHIKPSGGFSSNNISLGVLESDYNNAVLLLLDGSIADSWVNENYWHDGYFGRYATSTSSTTVVNAVKFEVGATITDDTTTFNDNIWRDIAFEHINTAFWFNHTTLNIIESIRVENCGHTLNSPLIKAHNLSRDNRIKNLLFGAYDATSYDVFDNGVIWGDLHSPMLEPITVKNEYSISFKDIIPSSLVSGSIYNCISEYFKLVDLTDLSLSDSFRYTLSDDCCYGEYSDMPAIVIQSVSNEPYNNLKVEIDSDTIFKPFVGILELVTSDDNNHVLSTDTAGTTGMMKEYNSSNKKIIVFSNNVKKAVIAFKYNNSTTGVFKRMNIKVENGYIVTNPQNRIDSLATQATRPNVDIRGFQYFGSGFNPLVWDGVQWKQILLYNAGLNLYDIPVTSVIPTVLDSGTNYYCVSEYLKNVNPTDLTISDLFRFNLPNGYGNTGYLVSADIPFSIVQFYSNDQEQMIIISSSTEIQPLIGILEKFNNSDVSEDNNYIKSTSTDLQTEGMCKKADRNYFTSFYLGKNIKKVCVGFKFASTYVFDNLQLLVQSGSLLRDKTKTLESLATQDTLPTIAIKGFQYFGAATTKPVWYNGTGWVDATGTPV